MWAGVSDRMACAAQKPGVLAALDPLPEESWRGFPHDRHGDDANSSRLRPSGEG